MGVWYQTSTTKKEKPSFFYEFRVYSSVVFKSLQKELRFTYQEEKEKFKIDENNTLFSDGEIIQILGDYGQFVSH